MKKRIIFFDAKSTVLPAIRYAKSRGCHVITCDNLVDNPGHKEADESLLISTYDTDAINEYIEKNPVDGVVYFASGHGYYAGCKIIEKFHLPGITESIKDTLSYKNYFRQYLKDNGFTSFPKFELFNGNVIPSSVQAMTFPVIVKPTDCGGNTGITKVNSESELQAAVNYAHASSRSGNVIIEEFIDGDLQVNGDCIIEDGIVKIAFLGKYLYPSPNSIIPCATVFGEGIIPEDIHNAIKGEIQKIVTSIGIKAGAINVEFRVSSSGKIYFIEVNSRHSGNFIYAMMNKAYGISTEEIAVQIALGESLHIDGLKQSGFFAYALIYSEESGIFSDVSISEEVEKYIFKKIIFKKPGDQINKFTLLSDRVGLCLLQFPSYEELNRVTQNFKNYFQISFQEK